MNSERSVLDGIPALAGLPSSFLSALAAGSTVRHFSRHGVVSQEGSVPAHVFIVLRGKVRAVRRSGSGREVTLETFQVGDVLGDALGGRPLTNDWEAAEPTDLLAINRDSFASHLQTAPSLGLTTAVSPPPSTARKSMRAPVVRRAAPRRCSPSP